VLYFSTHVCLVVMLADTEFYYWTINLTMMLLLFMTEEG